MRTTAFYGLIAISIYHILNIFSFFDFNYIWGGKVEDKHILILLECIALIITVYLSFNVYELIKGNFDSKKRTIALKIGFFVFLFSFIGNLLSDNLIEKIVCSSIAFFYTIYFYYEIKNTKSLI